MGVRETVDPLIGSLLRAGIATTDELGMGLRADEDGLLVGAVGAPIWLVGALRRGDLWESTAVPELRMQAARAAAAIAARLGAAPGAAARAAHGTEGARPGAGCG
jgi:uncharacterized NAD(P)/FAD-binding protein YdhS